MTKNKWIKPLRVLTYGLTSVGAVVGASLIKNGGLSASYANGTYAVKIQSGEIIFFISIIILCVNILWGILRWFLRGYQEKWKPKQIIGKLIGGGIWRGIVFLALIIFSSLLIAPNISEIISEGILASKLEIISFSEHYDRLKYINDHIDELNRAEIEDELFELLFNNIGFDTDASGNIATRTSGLFGVQNASAYSSNIKILNKAVLSKKGNFVVFYTDTGDDKISEDKANELCDMLEEIIVGYENNLDLKYEYHLTIKNMDSKYAREGVLWANGIDTNILETAMPVYVINPYKKDNDILATYAGKRFSDLGNSLLISLGSLLGEETAMLYSTTPSYPFINILPSAVDSESLAIVAAHELGHHYVANYNYNHFGNIGSDDDFIDETGPNWMAINVLSNQPANNLINRNHYNGWYLKNYTSVPIDKVAYDFPAYPAVAFLENYYTTIPNSKDIIMSAIHHGDALNYLHQAAGEDNFTAVMSSLAEKNLTGKYNGKLTNESMPNGNSMQCVDVCSKDFQISPVSTQYVYFSTSEYQNDKIIFQSKSEHVYGSLLGKKIYGEWEVIESKKREVEFDIKENNALEKYEVLAFAVANSGIDQSESYTVGSVAEEIEKIIETAGKFNFGNVWQGLENGCFEINTDSILDNFTNLLDFGHDFIDVLKLYYAPDDLSDIQSVYDEDTNEIRESVATTKAELAKYQITICAEYINSDYDFETVQSYLRDAMGYNINVYNETDDDDRTSVFIGFNLLERTGKIYTLLQMDGEMGLVTINVSEK